MKLSKETRRVEGRDQPRESPRGEAGGRTQSRGTPPPNLARVNAAARRADQTRFSALLHHIDRAALERSSGDRSGRQVRESMG
jgi:RNA-directed DNA polymerase